MGVESYKHQFAKTTLTQWLRDVAAEAGHDNYAALSPVDWRVNRKGPNWGVWTEYPICGYREMCGGIGDGQVWDETDWDDSQIVEGPYIVGRKPNSLLDVRPPSYEEVIGLGLTPLVIFDVAVQHKGFITYALEVVHRNDISDKKLEHLKQIGIQTYTIDADWILTRVKRPTTLVCKRVV